MPAQRQFNGWREPAQPPAVQEGGGRLIQLGGGLSLLLGIEPRLGALLLLVFLIPVTVMYHPFWKRSGADFVTEADHFLSNLAIIGGMLVIVALGGGPSDWVDHSFSQLLESISVSHGVAP